MAITVLLMLQFATEVLTEVHCSFITLLWYGCFRSSLRVLAPIRVKEIPQEQPLRRPQHLRHIPITVHMRICVKGATTRRGARNTFCFCAAATSFACHLPLAFST
jgi:hypothetical protein